VPKAWLVLKTYDPESGVVLKFKTDRAADVGRLINGLGRLGRHMAALPEKAEGTVFVCFSHSNVLIVREAVPDVAAEDVPMVDVASTGTVPSAREGISAATDTKPQQAAGGGGGKKKKKGKK